MRQLVGKAVSCAINCSRAKLGAELIRQAHPVANSHVLLNLPAAGKLHSSLTTSIQHVVDYELCTSSWPCPHTICRCGPQQLTLDPAAKG